MGKKRKKGGADDREKKEKKAWEVDVRSQRYIRTPTPDLVDAMLDQLETEAEKRAVIDLSERLEALYALRSASHREALRRSFDIFCPDQAGGTNPASLRVTLSVADNSGVDHPTRDIEEEEDVFLQLLHMAFSKANYDLLGQSEYDSGKAESFEVTIDLELNPKKLDYGFIERLHARMDQDPQFEAAAEVTQKVLVYHRGQGQETISGMFLMEKIDIVLTELFALAIWLVWFAIGVCRMSIDLKSHFRWAVWLAHAAAASVVKVDNGATIDDDEILLQDPEPTVDEPKTRKVYRNTLRGLLKRNWLMLFTPVTLLEPTFREMVVVYRTKEEAKTAAKEGRVPRVEIKTFANVPMADFEIILPAQRTVTRATDVLKLVGVVAGAAAYVYKSVQDEFAANPRAEVEDVVADLFPVLLGAGTYASKAVTQWMNAQKKYNVTITQYLYEKSMANNYTVFAYVMDSIIHQEHKEALLAYFFLWNHGANSIGDLDEEIERFLARLNEDIDFDAQDALDKLASDGFIKFQGQLANASQLFYLPITQCIHKAEEKVTQVLYNRNRPCPYCSILDDLKPR
eukprot:m.389357 g.389357  ORF g.389357 m.389357 type:complete len:571 (+) comp28293_c1_seq5:2834-4546(+)